VVVFAELQMSEPDEYGNMEILIKLQDGSSIPIKHIIGQFTCEQCPQLVDKPKLFFFLDSGLRTDSTPQKSNTRVNIIGRIKIMLLIKIF
jgi:hypothetical protein